MSGLSICSVNLKNTIDIKEWWGIRFWIDDQLVVDDWTEHSLTTYNPTIDLTDGPHTLRIEYFDAYDNAIVKFKQNN